MTLTVRAQAAAEYLAPTVARGTHALKVAIQDASDFIASPRGILVAGLVIFLLAVTVGRRRRV